VEVGGATYEAIPEALIVRAAMIAAAAMAGRAELAEPAASRACCASSTNRLARDASVS
jgi:hypothetical protein